MLGDDLVGRSFVPRSALLCVALFAAASGAAPAYAGELFGGLYVHDVKLPTDASKPYLRHAGRNWLNTGNDNGLVVGFVCEWDK